MQIKFDNVDLNTSPYFVEEINYEPAPAKDIFYQQLSRERGGVIIHTEYNEKIVVVKGTIKGTSKADLDDNIDDLLELLSRENKNLDIDHSGGTRRFKATKVLCSPARKYYSLNYAKYEAQFIVPEGIGKDTTLTNISDDDVTVASKSGAWTVGGSAYPNPTIKLTFDSATSVSKIELTVNGDKITLTETISASDVVIFDVENKKVTINGTEKEYEGIFPKFIIGSNSYQIDVTSTSHQYDIDVDYTKSWL